MPPIPKREPIPQSELVRGVEYISVLRGFSPRGKKPRRFIGITKEGFTEFNAGEGLTSSSNPAAYNYYAVDNGLAAPRPAHEMYEILGIPVNSSIKNIKKVYKAKALELHPNKGGITANFQELQAEYEKALKNKQTKGGRRTRKSKHNRSKTRRSH